MKTCYEKPVVSFEEFTANEYVAACGDSNYEYLFECNANSDGWLGKGGSVYEDTNKNGEWDRGSDKRLGSYSPCGEKHKTQDGAKFLDGFLVSNLGTNVKKVKIWRGEDEKNIHCTTNLNMDSWETAKS